jgi:hypothetical protein
MVQAWGRLRTLVMQLGSVDFRSKDLGGSTLKEMTWHTVLGGDDRTRPLRHVPKRSVGLGSDFIEIRKADAADHPAIREVLRVHVKQLTGERLSDEIADEGSDEGD